MVKQLAIEDLTILVDSREQLPFHFVIKDKPVKTEIATLTTGDYTVRGLEEICCVERKSLDDLMGVIGSGRERFERELKRMLGFPKRMVIVEASWDIIKEGNYRAKIHPKAAVGSILGWIEMGIPFFFARDSTEAAQLTGNFLFICANRRFRELQAFFECTKSKQRSKDLSPSSTI